MATIHNPQLKTDSVGHRKTLGRGRFAVSLFDQALVSGVAFLVTIIIARGCGPEQFGIYIIANSVLLLAIAVQESTISLPLTIFGNRETTENRHELGGSSLIFFLFLAAIIAIVCGVASFFSELFPGDGASFRITFQVLAIALPAVLFRQLTRRHALAQLHVGRILVMDLIVAAIQISGLLFLWQFATLSAATAYVAIGCATGICGLGYLYALRSEFIVRFSRLASDWKTYWSFSSWALCSRVAGRLQDLLVPWIIIWMLGVHLTAAYGVCFAIVSIPNPFLIGIANLLVPHTTLQAASGESSRVMVLIAKYALGAGVLQFWISRSVIASASAIIASER